MPGDIPKAGEWWVTSWGPIVYVVGRMFGRGIIVQYRDESTQAIKKTEVLSEWRRLPDDAGFDWKEPQQKPEFTGREKDLLEAIANLRDNMDRIATRVVNLEQRMMPFHTIGGSGR